MPHIHEKIDFIADVFVVNKGAVLLRMHDKYGEWWVPGGHIEPDEDPVEAALREVKEEVNLNVELIGKPSPVLEKTHAKFLEGGRDILAPRFVNRHYINKTHEHISLIYFAKSDTREVTQGKKELSDKIKWFSREELDEEQYRISEIVKYYAKAALDACASE